jgi:DNA-binding transcriptional ArsR family regulator
MNEFAHLLQLSRNIPYGMDSAPLDRSVGMKAITEIDDARLVKGLAHPLRIHILNALQDRVASPSEIAEELQAPLGNVSYHVRFLARVGLIELAGTEPRRGAVEHYYRAVGRPQISAKAWEQVPQVVKDALIGSTLDEIGEMVAAAARTGGFDRNQAHVSRKAYSLDQQGFDELSEAVVELQARAEEIQRESASRLADSEEDADELGAGVVMMLFEARDGDGDGDGRRDGDGSGG